MRGAKGRPVLRILERAKLGLPLALFFCLLFFFAGFFGSMFVSQDFLNFGRVRRVSLMELSEVDVGAVEPATRHRVSREAESGISFQILSWRPRAVYFPKFATLEQCLGIIKNSRSKLSPSTLALRDGETAENTKGTRMLVVLNCSTYCFNFSNISISSISDVLLAYKSHRFIKCFVLEMYS